MKPTIWIFSLEPIETRYTAQWHEHLPKLITDNLGDKFNVVQIDGIQKNSTVTPGAFLNFSDTNYWKSSQLCSFLEHHNNGETSAEDHFIFADAWNPTILQIKYMSDLLKFNWTTHGLWHAGSYDPQDFLGRLIGDAPWVRHSEQAYFHAFDHNYFATQFHSTMFLNNLLDGNEDRKRYFPTQKIIHTGWPMEYMSDVLEPYKNLKKRNLVLFPHRIAPEKQVEIFRDLAKELPEYEFVVCQDKTLTKHEYHTLLGEAKVIFSANLQETLGISCYEGALVGAIPMVPDRLSYTEMYDSWCKYPSLFTENWAEYIKYKKVMIKALREHMTNYEHRIELVKKQADRLTEQFFSANNLVKNIK
jgi:glycosyltransferase involved in cell wall biosynthesis